MNVVRYLTLGIDLSNTIRETKSFVRSLSYTILACLNAISCIKLPLLPMQFAYNDPYRPDPYDLNSGPIAKL